MKLSFWKLSVLALTTSLFANAPIAATADTNHKHMEKGHDDKDGHKHMEKGHDDKDGHKHMEKGHDDKDGHKHMKK